MYIIYSLYRYYKKVSTDLICVDDSGITQTRNGTVTQLSWEEITKVEWRGKDADKFSALTVVGTDKVIGIGEHIDGLGEIIQFIKFKVGERFNTHNIPWELKNPKISKEK
jgi:hypothetical protein